MKAILSAALVIGLCGLAGAQERPKAKIKTSKIDGLWVIESHEVHGKATTPPGGDFVEIGDGRALGHSFKLGDSKKPMWIDLTPVRSPDAPPLPQGANPLSYPGIVKLDGNRMQIAFSTPNDSVGAPPGADPNKLKRPTAFNSKTGVFYALRRATAAEKKRYEEDNVKGGKSDKGIEFNPKPPDPGLDPDLKPVKKQGKSKIDGVWVIESVKQNGKADEEGVGDAVHFAEGKLNFGGDLRTFTLDGTKTPMWWDWSHIPNPEEIGPLPRGGSPVSQDHQGIAKIEDGKLYLAYRVVNVGVPRPPHLGGPPPGAPARPTAFDAKNSTVIVLRRGNDNDLKRLTAKPEPEVDLIAKNKDKPAGKSKLDGYWVVVSSKYRGEADPDWKGVVHFENGVWKSRYGVQKFAVDESKNPMWIDFVRVPGDLGGGPKLKGGPEFREPRQPGIFKIDKDTLHWAYTVDERPPFGPSDKSLTPRPRSFNSREGIFLVLRRATIDDWKRQEAEPVVPGPILPGTKKGPPGKDPGPGLPGVKPKLPGKLSLLVPENAPVFVTAEVGDRPAWKVPSGWKEQEATVITLAAFSVTEKDKSVKVTVTPLNGNAGGLLANANRWRAMLKLPEWSVDELNKAAKKHKVDRSEGVYLEFTNGSAQTTIGVIVVRDDTTWFFKLTGDAGLAKHEKENFLKFLDSVKFK